MASLEGALRASGYFAAYYDTPDDRRVIVERTSAGPRPEDGATYTAKVERGTALPEGNFTSADLGAVTDYLRALRLAGFDPEGEGWQPATRQSYAQSAEWSVDAPERGLSPEDSHLGAHTGETLP